MEKHFKLLLSINDLYSASGGPSKAFISLASHLTYRGIDLRLISKNFSNIDTIYQNLSHLFLQYKPELKISFRNFIIENQLAKILENIDFQYPETVVHDHGIWLPSNNTICSFARKKRLKLLISPHGTLDRWSFNQKKFKKNLVWNLYEKNNLNNADVLHACSEKEADNFLRKKIKVPIAIIPNGSLEPTNRELFGEFSLNSLGIKNTSVKNLLFVGRIHPVKGLENLIFAVKNTLLTKKDWRLIIAGYSDNNYRNKLKKIIFDNSLEEKVLLLGAVSRDELINLYRNSKFFVLPSFSENFGIVVSEALTFGLPVITTHETPWAIIEEKNCGWVIEPTINDISIVINKALNLSEEEYNQKSLNAKNLSKEYSWKEISESFVNLYLWMLGHKNKPKCII